MPTADFTSQRFLTGCVKLHVSIQANGLLELTVAKMTSEIAAFGLMNDGLMTFEMLLSGLFCPKAPSTSVAFQWLLATLVKFNVIFKFECLSKLSTAD